MRGRADPAIVVLGGGTSAEREVSLASSRAVYEALRPRRPARWHDLEEDAIPRELDPDAHLIFPVLHGGFGEDGRLQGLLEEAGFVYAGCDADSSNLCMDKERSKRAVSAAGVETPAAVYFDGANPPSPEVVESQLGTWCVVVKPTTEGSSVGLGFAESRETLAALLAQAGRGRWMIEPRLKGYDVTVGVLDGRALGVVEIRPKDGGAYDFAHKYTPGQTDYRFPADLSESLTSGLRAAASDVFRACGCRDFARVDFFLRDNGFVFLEINTIPGLTATSLLPKSAQCEGYDFPSLVEAMLQPALDRFHARVP